MLLSIPRHRVSSVLGFLWPDKPLCPPTQQRLPSPMYNEMRGEDTKVHLMWCYTVCIYSTQHTRTQHTTKTYYEDTIVTHACHYAINRVTPHLTHVTGIAASRARGNTKKAKAFKNTSTTDMS